MEDNPPIDTQQTSNEIPVKKRKTRDLPLELALLTDKDRDKFALVLEIDINKKSPSFSKEFLVAKSVTLQSTSSYELPIYYDLATLTVDHLRKLCKNIGIVNCGSHNKFNCRKAIATYFRYQEMLTESGLKPTSHSSRVTSTVCRVINVVFSTEFVEDFKSVNDRKTRQDHETQRTNKAFWMRAALAYNSCSESAATGTSLPALQPTTETPGNVAGTNNINNLDECIDTLDECIVNNTLADYDSDATPCDSFDKIIYPLDDVYLSDLASDPEINLLNVDQVTTEAFRKKILDLFKIRRKMKQNMNISGTHDNEVWNFVEAAMIGYDTGFTKVAVYYFYVRCEQTLGIDSAFQPFLDESMRGDSALGWVEDVEDHSALKKKRDREPDPMLESLLEQGKTLLQHLSEAAEDRQTTIQNQTMLITNQKIALVASLKRNKFNARLEVAKALNDTEELKRLMEEARSMDVDE
jgi:hypothetical protein